MTFVHRSVVLALVVAGCSPADKPQAPTAPAVAMSPVTVESKATSNGATPMFLMTPGGAKVLSWVAAPDSGSEGVLFVRVEAPDGKVTTSGIHDPLGAVEPHGEAPPQLAAGADGSLYALYTVGRDTGGRFAKSALRFSRSTDGGATWSAPQSLNEGEEFGSNNFHSLLAGNDGTVYAAWLSSVDQKSGVWLRVSSDGGKSWNKSKAIHPDPTCPCCRTGLALAPDGTLYSSYRKIFPGDVRDMVVMASHDKGATWSAPVRPRADEWVFPGCPHAGASLKVDATGAVHIAWWTGKAGAAGVWYGVSKDGGATWTATPIDTGATSAPAHVQLALTGATGVVVAWDDGKSKLPRILLRASADGGTTFGKALEMSDARSGAATFPVLAVDRDSLTVAWSQKPDSSYRAELAMREAMKHDKSVKMGMPRVGQQEVLARRIALSALPVAPVSVTQRP
ncbi:MAG: sialidase family protein [Gemmatimonadota bacterium]